MFQQTYERPRKPVRVRVVLASRTTLDGNVLIIKEETLAKSLNGSERFVIFESGDDRQYLSKDAIESITESDGPTDMPLMLETSAALSGRFASAEPHVVLGVAPGADVETIRDAYHRLAREFHADRMAALGLHAELAAYAEEVMKRINLAYNQMDRAARSAA